MRKFPFDLHKNKFDIFFVFLFILSAVVIFFITPKDEITDTLYQLENKTFDFRQKIISKNKTVNKDIIIITVDDPSYEYLLEKYGEWPIPRNVYAEILDYIQSQNPKYVAFDLMFIKSLNRVPQSDLPLIKALGKYQNTYTEFNFDNYSPEVRKPPEINEKLSTPVQYEEKHINPEKYINSRMILPEIIDVTDKIGHANTSVSPDGIVRTVPVIVSYGKDLKDYLFMCVKLASDYLNKYENQNILTFYVDKHNNLLLGNRIIPLTKNGEAILNWYGESGSNVKNNNGYKYIPFWKVLKSTKMKDEGLKEQLPSDMFKDKIVFISTDLTILADTKKVPTSNKFPEVEVSAVFLNNILDNNFISKASTAYNLLITFILALTAVYTVFKTKKIFASVLLFFIFNLFYLYFSIFVMEKYNIWIWIVIPVIVSTLIFIISYIIKYILKSRDYDYTYKLATIDGLTGLYNHRFFQEELLRQINSAQKNNTVFSLIMTDIDYFKKFNDKYGHQAGDIVLKHISNTLKQSVRNKDFVCRYGGEEMAVILVNTDKKSAVKIAEDLCKTVASNKYPLSDSLEVEITLSLGCSTFPENGKTPEELIEYADKCLYSAKENGRNKVGFID